MDIAALVMILAILLVVFFQAGALFILARLSSHPLSIWVGWFAFFLLLAASREGSVMVRVIVSSSSASAVYQLTTNPCFRRKDFELDKETKDPNNDIKGA